MHFFKLKIQPNPVFVRRPQSEKQPLQVCGIESIAKNANMDHHGKNLTPSMLQKEILDFLGDILANVPSLFHMTEGETRFIVPLFPFNDL